jgi:nucleoside-diphosphate-sugar epimerase
MKQISILGCGWLGLPLAKSLLQKGFSVNGSTTSTEKILVLKNSGISSFEIILEGKTISGNIQEFLKGSETLIIDIPPKLRGNSKENFIEKMETLIPYIENSTIKNVLFVSSTSVYAEDNSLVTEDTKPQPETEGGRQLLAVEQILLGNSHFKTTTLRFGGLIGEDRNPVRFLAGRKNIESPKAFINLIHQEDCIGIILKILAKESWNETYNAAAPFHPSREDYYTQKAVELNLVAPEFNYEMPTFGKIILSNKVENSLEYTFKKPNL